MRTETVTRAVWFGLLLVGAACGPSAVEDEPACLKLAEPAGGAGLVTSLPARIALFFSVDTCGGQPVPGLDATHFDIEEDGRPVSTFESRATVKPKGERYRMSSLLLLDVSGSVLKGGRFPALREAATRYVQTVLAGARDGQRVAVMSFDGRERPQLLAPFTESPAVALAALASLEQAECSTNAECAGFPDRRTCAGWRCVDDSTNLNGAVTHALDALDAQLAADQAVQWRDGALVVFTDGTDQAARVAQKEAVARAAAAKAHVFTVGLGGETDEQALRSFGKDGYFPASMPEHLAAAFDAIAARVTGLANRFYLLEYCSPKRSGVHSLRLTATLERAKALPLSGSFKGEFDATGFGSGCTVE